MDEKLTRNCCRCRNSFEPESRYIFLCDNCKHHIKETQAGYTDEHVVFKSHRTSGAQ